MHARQLKTIAFSLALSPILGLAFAPFQQAAHARVIDDRGVSATIVDANYDDWDLRRAVAKARNTLPHSAQVGIWKKRSLDHALTIVRAGCKLGLPKRLWVVAVATAMQESTLANLASDAVPESLGYPHDRVSEDHDSVGLFQQRPSQGWGSVKDLMDTTYATYKFYEALQKVLPKFGNWHEVRLTVLAQAVQISGYPNAYQKHESDATKVVDFLEPYCRF